MAETFKSSTKESAITDIDDANSALYTVPSANNTVAIVLGLILANKSTNVIKSTVKLIKNVGDDAILLKDIAIPNGSTLEMFAGQKLVLQGSDQLRVASDTATSLDVTLSYLEIDNT